MPKILTDQTHAENVLQRMWDQCECEELCDVVLIGATEEMRLPAHRAVLSASSEYFRGMFKSSMSESVSKEVKLTTGDGEVLRTLIKFCYTGRIEIEEDVAEEMLKMADYFSLEFVVNTCATFLTEKINPTNCLGFALFAERYHCQSLLTKAIDCSLRHFSLVQETEEFLDLNPELLGQLLASDKLCVSEEEDVYESLEKWLKHDPTTREKYRDGLLKFVRMPLVDPSFLINRLKSCTTISFEHDQLIGAIEWHLLPEPKAQYTEISPKLRTPDSMLLAITKDDLEIYIHHYCPKQLKWMKCLRELPLREEFSVAVLENNMYIVGGVDIVGDDDNPYLNTVLSLNFKTMTMEEVLPMKEHRTCFCAAAYNGFLYALGGWDVDSSLNSVERWDAKTRTWSTVLSMSIARSSFDIVILSKKIYVVGGLSNSGSLNSAEYYDPHNDKWTTIAPMKYARSNHAITVANGLLYAIGGYKTKTAEFYDPRTNKWTAICSLTAELDSPKSCITINNKVMVFYKDHAEEYDPVTNKWEMNATLKGLDNIKCIFSYSGEFAED